MRASIPIAAVLLLVVPLSCCGLNSRVAESSHAAENPAPIPNEPGKLGIEILPQADLTSFLHGMGIEPPGKFLVPDVVYMIPSKALLLAEEREPAGSPHHVINYADLIVVAWRERSLYASVDNHHVMITIADMGEEVDEFELLAELESEGLVADPEWREPKWRKVRTERKPVRFWDDEQRDRVAEHGWQA